MINYLTIFIFAGKAHGRLRPYGFTANYWEKLGEIIVDVVLVQEAVRDLPGAGQAWVIFIACLVDQVCMWMLSWKSQKNFLNSSRCFKVEDRYNKLK